MHQPDNACRLWTNYTQAQIFFVAVKITIVMQEIMLILNTIGRNQTVNRFTDSNPLPTQEAIIPSALHCQIRIYHLYL